MNFGVLSLLVLAGLAGPLLGASRRLFVPVAIGEILAGVALGTSGTGSIDPANPTISFLSDVGFAMLMFTVGMHVPLRDKRLVASLRRGTVAAAVAGGVAAGGGFAAAAIAGGGHAAVYAVVVASGSAAVVLPALEEARLSDAAAMLVTAWVTVADVATIVLVPLVLQPARAGHAAAGGALVVACALGVLAVMRIIRGRTWVHAVRRLSKRRHWALDLRLSLLIVFGLAWVAQSTGTSVLIAGFSAGLLVAWAGGPKRLSRQVVGVSQGFLVPLFFVVLGARLDLGGVFSRPAMIELTAALVAFNVVGRVLAARVIREGMGAALAATAQLGVPAAVVSLGLHEHVLSEPVGSAVIIAALVSLITATAGVDLLGRRARVREAAAIDHAAAPKLPVRSPY